VKTKAAGIAVMLILIAALGGCNRGPNDETLTQQVKAKISSDPALATQTVNVAVKDGAVTLAGNVNTETNKARAEDLAKSVEGVKSVTDNTTVRPLPVATPAAADPVLTGKINEDLKKAGCTGATVTVVGGKVTVTGTVPAAKYAECIQVIQQSGITGIDNQLKKGS